MDEPAFTLSHTRIAIIGLGLMGGSLALALNGRCRALVGVDPDDSTRALARAREVTCFPELGAALDTDLLILATPVRSILSLLASLSDSHFVIRHAKRTFVIDLGSTKGLITSAMQTLPPHFDPLGGHPMCGKEVSGFAHADPELFRDKTFVLTPLPRTSPAALTLALELVAALGAQPLLLAPEQHDQLAATSSHLPYLAATALMQAAQSLNDDLLWAMTASGFRDTSRLAASDLTMMIDILLTNRPAILNSLTRYRTQLDSLFALIESSDPATLRAALAPAQAKRSALFPSPNGRYVLRSEAEWGGVGGEGEILDK
jgi:prephenate dehydrogenase